jgi:hypothetical protein
VNTRRVRRRLTVIGLFATRLQLVKSGGPDLNPWTGGGVLVVAGLPVLRLRLRPGG